MSTTNIYFTNPAVISQLQSQVAVGAPSYVNVNSGAAVALTAFLNTQMTCPSGTSSGQDALGIAHHGMFAIGGNAFSGQEVFTSVGIANPSGAPWTDNHYVRFASQSKIIGGLVIAKMMEENLMKPTDTVAQYIPQFTGIAYYCTGSTGTLGTFSSGPGSYTGTYLPFQLGSVQIAHLLGFQVGIPSSEFLTGNSFITWQTTSPADYNLNLSYQSAINALNLGIGLGPTGCFASGNGLRDPSWDSYYKAGGFLTGPITDYVLTLCNCLRAGSVVLSFPPGATAPGFSNMVVPRGQYGVTMTLLSYACQQALSGTSYANNLAKYIRDKLFTPIGITNQLWWSACETGPDDRYTQTVEVSFRRNYNIYTGAYATGTIAPGLPLNSLVWSSQYPSDSIATNGVPSAYNGDPPSFNGGLMGRPSMYCKLLKLIINNGLYVSPSGSVTQVVSRQAINWMFNSFGCTSQLFEGRTYFGSGGPTANQKWCLGFMKQDDSIASSTNIDNYGNVGIITFPMSPSIGGWGGYYGTQFAFDIATGYYIIVGSQESGAGATINYPDWQRVTVPCLNLLSRV